MTRDEARAAEALELATEIATLLGLRQLPLRAPGLAMLFVIFAQRWEQPRQPRKRLLTPRGCARIPHRARAPLTPPDRKNLTSAAS
jgi:hypothetical protein